MLITVPCRPRSELLRAPDHCSVLGEVNFTNCPLAGRVVIGIRMGIVRPEQAKLQEPLGAFGKRVAGVALLPGGRCPRCTSSMIKCTSASPASAHHVRNKIKALPFGSARTAGQNLVESCSTYMKNHSRLENPSDDLSACNRAFAVIKGSGPKLN